MKNQPIPDVKQEDIDRIVRRDFPESQDDAVLDILQQYGAEKWHREGWRVKAAVLKLANGNLHALRIAMDVAKRDFRDVLMAAEYPEYGRTDTSARKKLDEAERDRVIDRDWEQYRTWLTKS